MIKCKQGATTIKIYVRESNHTASFPPNFGVGISQKGGVSDKFNTGAKCFTTPKCVLEKIAKSLISCLDSSSGACPGWFFPFL